MKTAELEAVAAQHLDSALKEVRVRYRTGEHPELVAACMRSMALAELAEEVRALSGKLEDLILSVHRIGGDVSSAAELIANAVQD